MPNNKANVSTIRGVQGGYMFRAPLSVTDVPTGYNWTPGSGWTCTGYLSEDGFTESASQDSSTELRDMNKDLVDETPGSFTETIQVTFMEIAKAPLETIYGSQNVTDAGGTLTVDHNWAKTDEAFQYAFLLLLKNGRKWVKHIPNAKATDRGDLTGNKGTAGQRQVTLKYLTDDDGSGCKDYIESTETPTPALTSLTISATGATLSPTFSASTYSYSCSTTGTSITVTAAAGSGKTVSVISGENSYSSGSAVPLVTGANKVIVRVTDNTYSNYKDYVIAVTKS